MRRDADARARFTLEEFPVGHMVYVEKGALKKLQEDVASFIKLAVEGK